MTHTPDRPPEEVSFPTATEFAPERPSLKDVIVAAFDDQDKADLDRLGARAAEVIDTEVDRAEEYLDTVDALARDKAEAALAPARAEHERVQTETRQTLLQQTGSLLGGLLVRRRLATTQAQLAETQDTLAIRQEQLVDAERNLRGVLEVQVSVGVRRLIAQLKAGEADQRVADAAAAIRGVRLAQAWAEGKRFVAELRNDDLAKEIADKEARLAKLNAAISAAEVAKDGYRWPTGADDEGTGVLAEEKPLTRDDDEPGALIPDAGRIVDRDGTIAAAFAGGAGVKGPETTSAKDPDATRVIPKVPDTVIISTEQR